MSRRPKSGRTLLGVTTVYPSARNVPFTPEYLADELERRAVRTKPADLVLLNAASILRRLSDNPKARCALFGDVKRRIDRVNSARVASRDIALDYAATKRRHSYLAERGYAKRALADVMYAWAKSEKTIEGYYTEHRKWTEQKIRELLDVRLDKRLTGDDAVAAEQRLLWALSQEIREGKYKTP